MIYFALTDRFSDGDASNNVPEGSDEKLFDKRQRDITKYHGGDFRGLEKAMAAEYFDALGVTALWLTPPSPSPCRRAAVLRWYLLGVVAEVPRW